MGFQKADSPAETLVVLTSFLLIAYSNQENSYFHLHDVQEIRSLQKASNNPATLGKSAQY